MRPNTTYLAVGVISIAPIAVKAESAFFNRFERSAPPDPPRLAQFIGSRSIAGPSANGDQNGVPAHTSNANFADAITQTTTASIKLGDNSTSQILGNSWGISNILRKAAPSSFGLFCVGLLGLIGIMKIRRARF